MTFLSKATNEAVAIQTAHLEASLAVAEIQDMVDIIGEISATGIPSLIAYRDGLTVVPSDHHEAQRKYDLWTEEHSRITKKLNPYIKIGALVSTVSTGFWYYLSMTDPELAAADMPTQYWLVTVYTSILVLLPSAIATGIRRHLLPKRVSAKYGPKPECPEEPTPLEIPSEQQHLMQVFHSIVRLSEHPKAREQQKMLEALADKFAKLVWLASTAQKDAKALEAPITVGRVINDDVSVLRDKQQSLMSVVQTIDLYSDKFSDRINDMNTILDYAETQTTITTDNIGRAAALVMDEMDAILEVLETDL